MMRNLKPPYHAPEWAKHVVWYQVFPERFRNGDPGNDPRVEDIEGSWPHDHTSPWQIHPWTSDWYTLQPYEQENGRDIWFNLQRRRYGGDLQGIIDKLDYLHELGIGALYLNPVFQAPSLHKYDGATYHHIDPTFGPDPAGDRRLIASEVPDDASTWVWTAADRLMLELIRQVHARGMRIIFDGVFNHMGITSFAFQDVLRNQQKSRFKDWFEITSWENPRTGSRFDYHGWFGVRELPELREDGRGIVQGPREYIYAATRRWMDPDGDGVPSDGIDGWRLDVAFCVNHQFWKDWRLLVKEINPEAYLTAEVIDSIRALKPYLEGDEFDAIMNYNFAAICGEFFVEKAGRITASEFDRRLAELRAAFHPEMAYIMQNLYDSHDSNRLASHIVNRGSGGYGNWGEYFDRSKGSNPAYDTRKPTEHERRIQKLCALFQMTYVGAPMIYYGGEAGMWGANDPCCRKPMVWDDMTYEDEVVRPDGSRRERGDSVSFDAGLHEYYRMLISIRNRHVALRIGDFQAMTADDARSIYVFSRTEGNETVIVALNNNDSPQTATVPCSADGAWVDLLNGGVYTAQDKALVIHLEGLEGAILALQ
ncbi:alpha-glucosidase C-terminal domain-containing protein [Candidatus Fermentibacteria bacterium]|nr:alpha-glucosidase C-terminal domain-containing protein [Candidatus Fermentibacteria bacterium]